MNRFYLSLGANLGEREETLVQAVSLLRRAACDITALSSLYETVPWGKTDQPDFLNAALALRTERDGAALLAVCMDIERRLGRQRHEKWGARTIDLDLVYSPDEECHTVHLQLPHPYLTQRAFVLVPLQEIAPNLCFYGKSIDRWIHRVSQEGQQVRRYRKGNTWKKF
ncbi:2-amino-4-hydroxy-6-hydroxymethyldihydropteridine diphosphokinase [uncultured Megasphaera sp.]|jgi:hypothetical protein|uniref:2-amino-4-hydroxy-6- hydroxymethyldihydropteridine diphosphokinase n=1 Tax=uncultured Megasphaera sp. TaxID=165188 RepID=UPI0025845442|nr:2-amino-4-hydroxy-6-hydroxymethyldihydropteridine diphosphokinase [uncultured Megasphaera sp.]